MSIPMSLAGTRKGGACPTACWIGGGPRWFRSCLPGLGSKCSTLAQARGSSLGRGRAGTRAAWSAAAMRAKMVQQGVSGSVRVVAGRGERLPLHQGCVDVVWLSAVIHHVEDLDLCAGEIRRVVAADGTVLVRGLFADLGRIPSLELLPGSDRALAAFPAVATIQAEFARHGLQLWSTHTVQDTGPATIGQAADRIRRLRHADTLLGQFTDDEITDGLCAMNALDPSQSVEPATLGLLAFAP
jgi:SAM-dependent methyltransferase